MKKNRLIGFSLALIVLIADQFSKQEILLWFSAGGENIILTPFLNIIFTWNKGISFGLLRAGSPFAAWGLIALAVGIGLFVFYHLWHSTQRYQVISYGLILGGAVGNIIDRSTYGAVIDFIDFHIFGYHWYIFNIADCAIVIGAVLLVVYMLFFDKIQK